MLTRTLAAAALLTLGLTLTACGGDDTDAIASAGGDSTADSGASADAGGEDAAEGGDRETMLKYTQCLREQGLEVEDPPPGEGLRLQFGGPGGQQVDPSTVDKAMQACQEYAPQGQAAGGSSGMNEPMLEMAACMRENGVEDFPDPEPGQMGLKITPEIAEDPQFEAAEEVCNKILEDARSQTQGGQVS
ncbi:hypothetical protein ACIRON_23420 [Nocardioides sp. NPDC101246]|uniref:hypothetical protein n=1 Tax=Nocardioides sp. NPDC101246 TaxID=3364336 RepID=UPI00380915D6